MSSRLDALLEFLQRVIFEPLGRLISATAAGARALSAAAYRRRWRVGIAALLALLAYGLYSHPPFAAVRRGEVLVRTDVLDGSVTVFTGGTVPVLPGIHQVRCYSIRDQVYRPAESATATGPAPFQSIEGLSIGVDLTVRWTIDRARLAQMSKEFPDRRNCQIKGALKVLRKCMELVHSELGEREVSPHFSRYLVSQVP